MARSLRSKRKQANKRKLRADVFAPVEAARTARLAAAQKKIADEPKQADSSKNTDVQKKADESKKVDQSKKTDDPKSVEDPTTTSREATPMEEDTLHNDNSGMMPGTSARPPPPQDGKAGFLHVSVPETLGIDLPKTADQIEKEHNFFLRLGIGIDGLVKIAGDELLAVTFTEDIVGLITDNTKD